MSIYINHNTNDISTSAGARVTSGGNTVITTNEAATDAAAGIVELATTAEVQTGTDTGRVPSVSSLRGGLLVSGTAINTTSGTSHSFTGIPSWVKRITMIVSGVSTSGTSVVTFRLGTGGVAETTGYVATGGITSSSASIVLSNTAGFIDAASGAALIRHYVITFAKLSGNDWVCAGCGSVSGTTYCAVFGGSKTLAGTLDMVQITTINGTDTFDAGSVNIMYE